MKRNYTILIIINSLLIFVFTYAAVNKLFDRNSFQIQLSRFPLIHSFSLIISWALPITELVIAGMLVLPNLRLQGLYISLGILILFTMYITIMTASDKNLPCSCGGVISKLTWNQHLVFNLSLIALSVLAIILKRRMDIQREKFT